MSTASPVPLSQKGRSHRRRGCPGSRPLPPLPPPPSPASAWQPHLPSLPPGDRVGLAGSGDTLLRSPRPLPPIRPTWLQPHQQQRSGHCSEHGQAQAAQCLGTRSPHTPAQVSPGPPSPAAREALTVCSLRPPRAQPSLLTTPRPSVQGAGLSPGRSSDLGVPRRSGRRAGRGLGSRACRWLSAAPGAAPSNHNRPAPPRALSARAFYNEMPGASRPLPRRLHSRRAWAPGDGGADALAPQRGLARPHVPGPWGSRARPQADEQLWGHRSQPLPGAPSPGHASHPRMRQVGDIQLVASR